MGFQPVFFRPIERRFPSFDGFSGMCTKVRLIPWSEPSSKFSDLTSYKCPNSRAPFGAPRGHARCGKWRRLREGSRDFPIRQTLSQLDGRGQDTDLRILWDGEALSSSNSDIIECSAGIF